MDGLDDKEKEVNLSIDLTTLMCCGITEIHELEEGLNSKTNLLGIHHAINNYGGKPAFLLFTQAKSSPAYGHNLTTLIRKNKLGKVRISTPKLNPNSGNVVTVFLWEVNWVAYTNWFDQNKPAWLSKYVEF